MRQTANTRGILHPDAVGDVFSLERRSPPDDLAHLVDSHWLVTWDLRGRDPYSSVVLPHPCVHLVFEHDGAAVHGVPLRRFERRLTGAGWAAGTKFRPGGFHQFAGRPVCELTDRVLGMGEVFGTPGEALERSVRSDPERGPQATLAWVQDFLRAEIGPAGAPDPRLNVVRAIVADMLTAAPGDRVGDVAGRHHISERTLQRLFSAYVGVGPKWVLQRYRLHEAVERLGGRRDVDWARFALDLGYYDQAHFARDFRSLVGRTPAQYGTATASGGS